MTPTEVYTPSPELLSFYTNVKVLPSGQWAGIHRLLFHWTIHVGINDLGYDERWCLDTYEHALEDFERLPEEPKYWHKHYPSMIHRDYLTGVKWNDGDLRP